MGLFSKKVIVCEKCGKEFEGRGILAGTLCSDCLDKKMDEQRILKEKNWQ